MPYAVTQRNALRALLAEQDGRCHYCGRPLVVYEEPLTGTPPPDAATADHIVPLSLGGARGARSNKVASCPACNCAKADEWPTCPCDKCRDAVSLHLARTA